MSKLGCYILPPERGNGAEFKSFYQGDRILPEALVIHKRFNTPFTLNFECSERHYFSSGCTLSHFARLHLSKNVNRRREKV
ncbi:hypothetical protein MJK71_10855 [Escherichia coli]|nr:hypothetical protein MJK71_10855 [Escherichia coli]